MAEIELSALARQCLHRRIPDQQTLDVEAQAWVKERNKKVVKVDWRFTTADARIKLKHLYPKIQVWQTTSRVFLRIYLEPWKLLQIKSIGARFLIAGFIADL